jgi:hypothetical protein
MVRMKLQEVVSRVHDRAALDPGRDDERRDPVGVDVVGAVLRVVLDHEDRRRAPDLECEIVSTMRPTASSLSATIARGVRLPALRPLVWSL